MTKTPRPSYLSFDADGYPWKSGVDYRKHSEKYQVGKGEQGVLICEPYKSELLSHWQFRTPQLASKSTIYQMFLNYIEADDFVGADMARKFLQMGFTRARRYANYKGGIKYDKAHDYAIKRRGTGDPLKSEAPTSSTKRGRKPKRIRFI